MTIDEFLQCPKGMSFDEYEKHLKKTKWTRRRLTALTTERDFLEDAIQLLESDGNPDSDRLITKKLRLDKVNSDIDMCLSYLNSKP